MKHITVRLFLGMGPSMLLLLILPLSFFACGGDDGTEAQERGVGAQCATDDDCTEEGQECLAQFKADTVASRTVSRMWIVRKALPA
jgi:hypothetical protein